MLTGEWLGSGLFAYHGWEEFGGPRDNGGSSCWFGSTFQCLKRKSLQNKDPRQFTTSVKGLTTWTMPPVHDLDLFCFVQNHTNPQVWSICVVCQMMGQVRSSKNSIWLKVDPWRGLLILGNSEFASFQVGNGSGKYRTKRHFARTKV